MKTPLSNIGVTAGGLAALLTALGCVEGPVSGAKAARASVVNPAEGAQYIYARTCGYCHGSNVGPVILGRNLPPEVITALTRTGQGAMPAFRPTEISERELGALATWISRSKPSKAEHGR